MIKKFEKMKKSENKGEIETSDLRDHVKEGAKSALGCAEAVGGLLTYGSNSTTTQRIKREIERHVLEGLKSFLEELKRRAQTCDRLFYETRSHFRDVEETASDLAESCQKREKSAKIKKGVAAVVGVGSAVGAVAGVVGGVALTAVTGGVALPFLIGAGCAVVGGTVLVSSIALYDVFDGVEKRARELAPVLDKMGHVSSHMLELIQQLEATVTKIERKRDTFGFAEIKQHFRYLAERFDMLCMVFNASGATTDQAIKKMREVNEKIQHQI